MSVLAAVDPEVEDAIEKERRRLTDELVLIASENYASRAVREATGSVMTNKYAEGYPGHRYYAGCENVDRIELLAIKRAKRLFRCDHVNVQPHSGTQANMAAYFSVLKPGDRILGMRLDQGGHLSHGSAANFSGKLFDFGFYGVDRETELIDYSRVLDIARKFEPKVIVCGASAYPRVIDFEKFRKISDEVGALLLADIAHIAGLVAGEAHPSPTPWCDIITTTTHKTLRGPRGGVIMSRAEYSRVIDRSVFPNIQGGPFMHSIAGKAVAFQEALRPDFRTYAANVVKTANVLSGSLAAGGLRIVSGGTENHLVLVDVSPLGINGGEAEVALHQAGIVANKNSIPFDPLPPTVTSGLRVGTAALTSRNIDVDAIRKVGDFVLAALKAVNDSVKLDRIRREVVKFANRYPVPGID